MLVKKSTKNPNKRWKKCKKIDINADLIYAIYLDFNDPYIKDDINYAHIASKLIVKNFDKTNIDHIMTYWLFCPTYRPEFIVKSVEEYEKLIKENPNLKNYVIPDCDTTGNAFRLMDKINVYNFMSLQVNGYIELKYEDDLNAISELVDKGNLNTIIHPFILKNDTIKFLANFAMLVMYIKNKTGIELIYSKDCIKNVYVLDWTFTPKYRLHIMTDLTRGVLRDSMIKLKYKIPESFLVDVFKLNLENLVTFNKLYLTIDSYYEANIKISEILLTVVNTIHNIYRYLEKKGIVNKINKHMAHKKCKKLYVFDKDIEKMLPYLSILSFIQCPGDEIIKKLNIE